MGDSTDNDSVLSSLPSSPAHSDAETEPLGTSGSAGTGTAQIYSDTAMPVRRYLKDSMDGYGTPLVEGKELEQFQAGTVPAGFRRAGNEGRGRNGSRTQGDDRDDMSNIEQPHLTIPSTSSGGMISKSTRRMSFDDGSDLSALTSEAEEVMNEDEDEENQEHLEHETIETLEHNPEQGPLLDLEDSISRSVSLQLLDEEDQAHDNIGSSLNYAECSGSSHGSSSSSSSDTLHSSRPRHMRGKGRPPKKQNALAAAAKRRASRQASLSRSRSTGDMVNDTESAISQNAFRPPSSSNSTSSVRIVGKRLVPKAEISDPSEELQSQFEHTTDLHDIHNRSPRLPHRSTYSDHLGGSSAKLSETHQYATIESEQRKRPSAPIMDESSDDDYEEIAKGHTASAYARKKTVAGRGKVNKGFLTFKKSPSRGHTATSNLNGNNKKSSVVSAVSDTSARNSRLIANKHDKDDGGDDHHMDINETEDESGENATLSTNHATNHLSPKSWKIRNSRIPTPDTLKGTRDPMNSEHQILPPIHIEANMDIDDAMSGVSDDVPILQKAAALSVVAAIEKSPSAASISSALAAGSQNDLASPDGESAKPFLSVPIHPTVFRRGKLSAVGSRGRGRGGGRGRGKKVQVQRRYEQDDLEASAASATEDNLLDRGRYESPSVETPEPSDHEEDSTDLNAAKKRVDAIEALTRIEIEFALLRDRLYLERMEDVVKERWQIENGTHPELVHLTQVVDHRRQAKLELAGRALHEGEICNIRQAEAEYRAHWYNWTHDRSELRKAMLDEANIKKRRLDREKRSIERSRDEDLATVLRIHAPPPYLYYQKRPMSAYGQACPMDVEPFDGIQKKVKLGALGLDFSEALYDVERMGLRDHYRGTTSTSYFAFDPAYGPVTIAGQNLGSRQQPRPAVTPDFLSYGDYDLEYETHHSLNAHQQHELHPFAAQGRTVASVPQQVSQGRPDLFGGYRTHVNTTLIDSQQPDQNQAPASALKQHLSRPSLDNHLAEAAQHLGHTRKFSHSHFNGILNKHEGGSKRIRTRYESSDNSPHLEINSRFIPSYYALPQQTTQV